MNWKPKRFVIIQTSIGDYRQQFIDELTSLLREGISIICGQQYFYPSVQTNVVSTRVFKTAKNLFVFNRKLLFQWGIHRDSIQADVAVLEYNPRILNTWSVLVIRRLLKRRTVVWGHVFARSGKDNFLRRFQRNLADGVIVYTDEQANILREQLCYRGEIYAAPNSLYRKAEMLPVSQDTSGSRRHFLMVGRLVPEKKPELAIRAFQIAMARLPDDIKLLIVGDGPERERLMNLVQRIGVDDRIEFFGHVSNSQYLKNLYAQSLATISPGYVGLSITQSLGFGVPMIFGKDEPHAPEIVAAIEGWNSVSFRSDDAESLANTLTEFHLEASSWISRSSAISQRCRDSFCVEKMAEVFLKVFLDAR